MNYVRPVLLRLLTPAGVIFGSTHVLSQISYCDSKNINDSFHHPRFVKSNGKRVIGLGAAGVDYIATVDSYPEPDSKIRTKSLSMQGGGNAANTLTALSRLGFDTSMISKVGNDAHGEFILHDLQKEGVGTQCIVNTPGLATGFVYVLVDPRNQTRTCIATPVQEELTSTDMESVLTQLTTSSSTSSHNTSTHTPTSVHSTTYIDDISLVHLDSRHPLAASVLTQWAYRHGIPVSIDVEKDRPPYLLPLLPLCTFVFTNETFSRAYCRLLSRPHSDKSTNSTTSTIRKYKLIETSNTTKNNTYNNSTNEWISIDVYNGDKLEEGLGQIDSLLARAVTMEAFFHQRESGVTTATEVVVSTMGAQGSVLLRRLPQKALSNDVISDSNPSRFINPIVLQKAPLSLRTFRLSVCQSDGVMTEYELIHCSAWPMMASTNKITQASLLSSSSSSSQQLDSVVDTTGAGDAFIGGFLAALLHQHAPQECLVVGTAVAAEKLKSAGARKGLPSKDVLIAKFMK